MPSQVEARISLPGAIEADESDALIAAAKADLKTRNKDTPFAARTWKVILNDYGNLVVEENKS